jgi:acyl-coenzyme A synthetase/AMP-(fatty) acid ligase
MASNFECVQRFHKICRLLHISQNVFGSTECGSLLGSIGGDASSTGLLRPVGTGSFEFRPVASATNAESEHQSTAKLLELIILSDSGNCPHPSLRHADGHFHTGDLFEEVAPGLYASRGREDDWIKSENSLRCDTKFVPVL